MITIPSKRATCSYFFLIQFLLLSLSLKKNLWLHGKIASDTFYLMYFVGDIGLIVVSIIVYRYNKYLAAIGVITFLFYMYDSLPTFISVHS